MDNLRGMALMTAAMACFAFADAFVKVLSETHPQGQIITIAGIGGATVFAAATLISRNALFTPDTLAPAVLVRVGSEAVGTIGVILALSLTPLSVVTVIMQSVPLLVTLGAVVILKEVVGWRRWAAIFTGMLGVLMILRPGTEGFTPEALFTVMGAVCLAVRDLATRMVPKSATTFQLGFWGFLGLIPAGLFLTAVLQSGSGPFDSRAVFLFGAVTLLTTGAIYFVTCAMRVGDVAAVSPFRYSRLLFGLLLAILWFGERPDMATWIGAAIIAASGLYTFHRERQMARQAAAAARIARRPGIR